MSSKPLYLTASNANSGYNSSNSTISSPSRDLLNHSSTSIEMMSTSPKSPFPLDGPTSPTSPSTSVNFSISHNKKSDKLNTKKDTDNNSAKGFGVNSTSKKSSSTGAEQFRTELTKRQQTVKAKSIVFGLLFAVISAIILIPICAVALYLIEQQRIESDRTQVSQKGITAALTLRRQFEVSLQNLVTMSQFAYEWNYSIEQIKLEILAARLKVLYPEISEFEYLPGYKLMYIYPLTDANRDIIGIDVWNSGMKETLEKGVNEKRITVYGPVLLLEGKIACLGFLPIFYPNGTVWGATASVINFEPIFEKIDLYSVLNGYQYQLKDRESNLIFMQSLKGEKAFESGFGRANGSELQRITDSVEYEFSILENPYTIYLKPLQGWQTPATFYIQVVVAIVLVVAIFILVVVMTHQIIQDYFRKKEHVLIQNRLEQKVADRTKELAQSHSQLLVLLDRISSEEQKTRRILNSIDDALITVKQKEGSIVHCNSAFFSVFHFNEADLFDGKLKIERVLPSIKISEVFSNAHEDGSYSPKSTLGHLEGAEFKALTKEGKEIPVRISINFCTMFVNEFTKKKSEHELSKHETACVILIHNLSDKTKLLKDLKEKESLYKDLQDRIDFQEMFDNLESRRHFVEYCVKEHNDEGILFLEDVHTYKMTVNLQDRVNLQNEIYEKYLKETSPKYLNISDNEKNSCCFKIEKGLGELDLFNELEKIVMATVTHDSFKRWKIHQARFRSNTTSSTITTTSTTSQ